MSRLLRRLFAGRPATPARRPRPARLGLEALDRRDVPAVFTVTTLADTTDPADGQLTLREAVAAAHADADADGAVDEVRFRAGLRGTITLEHGEVKITEPLKVIGPGANKLAVSGNDAARVFFTLGGHGTHDEIAVTLTGLTLERGREGSGGAVYALNTDLTVRACTVRANEAGSGGGIYSVEGGRLTILNSTVEGNRADYGGGVHSETPTVVRNSTISGNRATGDGGGVCVVSSVAEFRLENSTVAANHADGEGGGVYVIDLMLGTYRYFGKCTLTGTVVGDNSAGGGGADVSGPVKAVAGLIEDVGGAEFRDGSGWNVKGKDPRLGPLADNGGPTKTHAPLAGSPAVDAGPRSTALDYDQRGAGFARLSGARVDIGAFEVQPAAPVYLWLDEAD